MRLRQRVIFLVAVLSVAMTSHADDMQSVTIACKRDERPLTATVNVTCNLADQLSEPVLVPVSSFAAEGPAGDRYIYKYLFGDRYQHVFQYDLAANGTLEEPILFEPIIHLSSEAIRKLRWLPPHRTAIVRIEWTPPFVLRRDPARWSMRVKMIYVRRSHFETAANPGER